LAGLAGLATGLAGRLDEPAAFLDAPFLRLGATEAAGVAGAVVHLCAGRAFLVGAQGGPALLGLALMRMVTTGTTTRLLVEAPKTLAT
jgi:hypothetical protein